MGTMRTCLFRRALFVVGIASMVLVASWFWLSNRKSVVAIGLFCHGCTRTNLSITVSKAADASEDSQGTFRKMPILLHNVSSRCSADWVKNCISECVNEKGPIPRYMYFIHYKGHIDIHQYLAVTAAKKLIKPDKIYFISQEPLSGCWWSRTLPYVEHHIFPKDMWVQKVGNQTIEIITHSSNFMRVTLLYNMGGIYMDTDVIAVRSFDSLLSGDYQAVVGNQEESLKYACNGVIVARKHSCFTCEFQRLQCDKFFSSYYSFSLDSLNELAVNQNNKFNGLEILSRQDGFNPFGWQKDQIEKMFLKNISSTDQKFLSVHLFHRAAITSGLNVWEKMKNFQWLSSSQSAAGIALRNALPEGFTEEHMDEEKCSSLSIRLILKK